MDIQNDALENASTLLEESLNPNEVPLSHNIFYFLEVIRFQLTCMELQF